MTDATETDVTVNQGNVKLVTDNPRRIALSLTNNGTVPMTVTRFSPASQTLERVIAPGDTYDFWWYNELGEITRAFFASSFGAQVSVHVREVVLVGTDV